MLQVADENAVASNRPFKFGASDGLRGVKDNSRSTFGKPPAKFAVGKPQAQQKTRTALGDLTNAMRGAQSNSTKLAQPSARAVSESPIEQLAGRSWQVMEKELRQQEEAKLQQQLDRIAAAASNWTTSHLYHELSSDDESDPMEGLDERFSELPAVVQLLAPRYIQGVTMPQPGSGFDTELYNLLPDVSPACADIELCFADDEA